MKRKHPNVDILNDWSLVEADFQREYNINLVNELRDMTWRRFTILLNGLSTDAIFIMTHKSRANGDTPIEDDEISERALDQLFK